jgi:ADP-ribose pyrophosphatase YjhB (NUDIX family)
MHIHEKIDFTATVYIVHEGRVLLRMHDKYNIWLPPGGHIELHEDPIEAAYREAKEESGLDIELVHEPLRQFVEQVKPLSPPRFMNRMLLSPGHEHVDLIYFAKAVTTKIHPDAAEKQVELKWFTVEELSDSKYALHEHVQYYASEALRVIK